MSTLPDSHPTYEELQAFACGGLEPAEREIIGIHLEGCRHCQRVSKDSRVAQHSATRHPHEHFEKTLVDPVGVPPLSAPPPSTPPELQGLQGYDVLRELGRGGMGVVYLARNRLMDRLEVLKTVNRNLVDQSESIGRFLQEIRSAARINHPNVATAYSALQLDKLVLLSMEYVDGSDLSAAVKSQGALPIANACWYIYQAALGLQRADDIGMVHRDIKPSNLILSRTDKGQVVKIIDFGLAKAKAESSADRDLTALNQMMGTPGYTAPEQIRDAKNADIRADIYSLGCTLFYLLAGTQPFVGASTFDVLLAQQRDPRPLRDLRPDVPVELAAIIARMMAIEPSARFQKPAEVALALTPYFQGQIDTVGSWPSHAVVGKGSMPTARGLETMPSKMPSSTALLSLAQSTAPPTKPRKGYLAAAFFLLVASTVVAVGMILNTTRRPPSTEAASAAQAVPIEESDPHPILTIGDLTEWKIVGVQHTNRAFEKATLVVHNRSTAVGDFDFLVSERKDFSDFRLRFSMEREGKMGRPPGLLLRVDPSPATHGGMRGYRLSFQSGPASDPGKVELELFSRGRRLKTLASSAHDIFRPGQWYDFEVLLVGKRCQVKVDGKECLDFEDPGQTFRRGAIGFDLAPEKTLRLRDASVSVLQMPPENPPEDPRRRWLQLGPESTPDNELFRVMQQVDGSNEWIESVTSSAGVAPAFKQAHFREKSRSRDFVELESKEDNGWPRYRLHNDFIEVQTVSRKPFSRDTLRGHWEP